MSYKCSRSLRTVSGRSQMKRRRSLSSNPQRQETEPMRRKPQHNPPHPSTTHFPIRTLMRSPAQGCQNKWGDHVFALFCEECNRCSLEPQGNSAVVIIHVVLLCRETWTAPGIQCMWRQTERRGERQTTRDSLGHCQRHLGRFIRCCRLKMLSMRNEDSLCASLL